MDKSESMKTNAYFVDENRNISLLPGIPLNDNVFKEEWIQDLIARNPQMLQAGKFGPQYDELVCIGREVIVNSGRIDDLYVSSSGDVVIVETKLFRNQESRREVVSQILDYAKDLKGWDAEKLNDIARSYSHKTTEQSLSIIDLLKNEGYLTENQEADLTDNINRCLSEANFLLLIVGDGIRSNVEELANFLNESAMKFNLGLVALEVYQRDTGYIVIPNLLAKTVLVPKMIYNFTSESQPAITKKEEQKETRPTSTYVSGPVPTRKEFVDRFAEKGGYNAGEILDFINDLEKINGIEIRIAPTELTVKALFGEKDLKTIMTFGGIGGDKKVESWFVPGRIMSFTKQYKANETAAAELLEFFRKYIDRNNPRNKDYEVKNAFYYFDVVRVLHDKDAFLDAVEGFQRGVREE